jgi:hypothetical protein
MPPVGQQQVGGGGVNPLAGTLAADHPGFGADPYGATTASPGNPADAGFGAPQGGYGAPAQAASPYGAPPAQQQQAAWGAPQAADPYNQAPPQGGYGAPPAQQQQAAWGAPQGQQGYGDPAMQQQQQQGAWGAPQGQAQAPQGYGDPAMQQQQQQGAWGAPQGQAQAAQGGMVPYGGGAQQGGYGAPPAGGGGGGPTGPNGPKGAVKDPMMALVFQFIPVYNIILMMQTAGEINAFLQRDAIPFIKIALFTMLTCGFYGIYWQITQFGPIIQEVQQRAGVQNPVNHGFMYVIPYYNIILVHTELNKAWQAPG